MYDSIVAKNVKALIKKRCLSQGKIGQKAGYSGKTFSNMLNGRKIITDLDALRIANALEVDANTLFGIEPEQESEQEPEKEVV